MSRVVSCPTKSTTLTLTDIGSLKKNFQNGTERRKARRILVMWESIFSLIRVYMVLSYPTKSMTLALTDIGFLQKFSKWNRRPKGSSNFGNVRIYLFVGTIVTIVYRVASSSTKSMTLAFTNIGFQKKNFQNETERRKARQFLVMREPIFSLEHSWPLCIESCRP